MGLGLARPYLRARGEVLPRVVDRDGVDGVRVPLVEHREHRGVGFQLRGLGQLREERLGVDVHAWVSIWGLGFGVQGLGIGVEGLGFRVWG